LIDAARLLSELQGQQRKLETDVREQTDKVAGLKERLESEYKAAREAKRTSDTFSEWREGEIAQAAVAWLLGCVFLRFCEDNQLIAAPLLAGPGDANRRAKESAREYFRQHPTNNDRHYLLHAFAQLAEFPAVAALYDPSHNPLFRLPISTDAAAALVEFWQQLNPDTGELNRDFTDPELDTRFLGDLYQRLSESARKRYALLQTPLFVEEFILDRTLDPAIETFGLENVRMIDPTCGSGHFLLGGFARINTLYEKQGVEPRERVKRALAAIYGVDLNPFAVAIARFRLLIAALKATAIRTLKEAPGWKFTVTTGDSLLHGRRFGELDLGGDDLGGRYEHYLSAEDRDEINRILGQQYHAVVGNPPYITVKDSALSELYRARYRSCHMKYSLGVPFTERFIELAANSSNRPVGYVGLITASSFMTAEFGIKLVENFLPVRDLTHVIDARNVPISGHDTSTVILFARNRAPVSPTVRVVLGLRGDSKALPDVSGGPVWKSILQHIDGLAGKGDFVEVLDLPRQDLGKHPWPLRASDIAEVIGQLEEGRVTIGGIASVVGIFGMTNAGDVMLATERDFLRVGVEARVIRRLVVGDEIRDWGERNATACLFPYANADLIHVKTIEGFHRWVWPARTTLGNRATFSKQSYFIEGRPWWEWHQVALQRLRPALSIVWAEIVSHSHFALDRGEAIFNQTAPLLKLSMDEGQDTYLGLLGLLNSSTANFWFRQKCRPKGGDRVRGATARVVKNVWDERIVFNSTRVEELPICEERPLEHASGLDRLARLRKAILPDALAARFPISRRELLQSRRQAESLRKQMIAVQEELDWWCYRAYGLLSEDLCKDNRVPELALGERAFEIVMARKMAAGELETTWFARHGSTPITELPGHWPEDYKQVVQRRVALIESHPWISLVEKPEYKRRWNEPGWDELEEEALHSWLANRLESRTYWPELALQTLDALTARAERDSDYMAVAALYAGQEGFALRPLLTKLLAEESVPTLKVLRYKDSGLRKRADWEHTWELQRQEDAIDADVQREMPREPGETDADWEARLNLEQAHRKRERIGDIAAPPKYAAADFLSPTIKRLRGDLDVPKERFFSLPRGDAPGESLYGWAGWNHAQRVRAIAGTYTDAETRQGWPVAQLVPLLIAVHEELPWVFQWHNQIDDELGLRLGDYFREWLGTELQKHGLTKESLEQWQPERGTRGQRKRA
jgi:hypothetical protein